MNNLLVGHQQILDIFPIFSEFCHFFSISNIIQITNKVLEVNTKFAIDELQIPYNRIFLEFRTRKNMGVLEMSRY